jgi:DNA-directed RNA polymerase specialized sigma24 family protein
MQPLSEVDWARIWKLLRVAAHRAVRGAPETFDCGVSAEDLASETLGAFFADPNRLGLKPNKGNVENFLIGVLNNKAKDHLRREKFVGGSLDDQDRRLPEPAQGANFAEEVAFREVQERLYALVGDDKDLRDLIAAVEFVSGRYNVNQELAEALDKTPGEIVNLRRRLLNVPGVRELYYGQRRVAETKG